MPAFLIVRLGALGDIVHTLPLLAALRARHPEARIDWLVDARHRAVLALVPSITRVVTIDTRLWSGSEGAVAVVRGLRDAGYDIAFDAQGLIKSAVLARLSGARQVVGLARRHLRERAAALFHTVGIDPAGARHVVDLARALARPVVEDAPRAFPLAVPASAVPAAVRSALGLPAEAPFAVINPGAAWPNKRWPADRFGAVAADLAQRHGLRSAVVWGPGEEALANAVVSASNGAAAIAPPTTLADLVAVLAEARLVVSGDTGPLHLAAAVGTPIVGLYGPTDPARNGPWGAADVVVSRSDRCLCHHRRRCRAARWCLDSVPVEEVTAAIARRLADHPPA